MTQDELAEELAVSQGTISNWELDRNKVPNSKLRQIGKIFAIPRQTLVEAIGRTDYPVEEDAAPPRPTGETPSRFTTMVESNHVLLKSIDDRLKRLELSIAKLHRCRNEPPPTARRAGGP